MESQEVVGSQAESMRRWKVSAVKDRGLESNPAGLRNLENNSHLRSRNCCSHVRRSFADHAITTIRVLGDARGCCFHPGSKFQDHRPESTLVPAECSATSAYDKAGACAVMVFDVGASQTNRNRVET